MSLVLATHLSNGSDRSKGASAHETSRFWRDYRHASEQKEADVEYRDPARCQRIARHQQQ